MQNPPAPQQSLERTKGTLHGRHGIGLFGYWLEVIPINDVITARARLNNVRSDTDLIEYSKKRDGTFPEFDVGDIPPGHVGTFPGTISATYEGQFLGAYYYKGEAGSFDSDARLELVLRKTGNRYQSGTIVGFLGNDITMAGENFHGFIIGSSFDTEKGRFDTNLHFGTGTWVDVYEKEYQTTLGPCSNGCFESQYGDPNDNSFTKVTRFTTGGTVLKNHGEGSIRGWTSEDGGSFSFPSELYGEVKVKSFGTEFNSEQTKEYSEDREEFEKAAERFSEGRLDKEDFNKIKEDFNKKYNKDFQGKINKQIDHNLHGVFVTTLEGDTIPGD